MIQYFLTLCRTKLGALIDWDHDDHDDLHFNQQFASSSKVIQRTLHESSSFAALMSHLSQLIDYRSFSTSYPIVASRRRVGSAVQMVPIMCVLTWPHTSKGKRQKAKTPQPSVKSTNPPGARLPVCPLCWDDMSWSNEPPSASADVVAPLHKIFKF